MRSTLIRRMVRSVEETVLKSAHASKFLPTKKVWPPDFQALNYQEQLRLEKKYKRRFGLATRFPRWNRAMKYLQLVLITLFLVYMYCAELEFWGEKYRASDLIHENIQQLLDALTAEKRYERRKDMVKPISTSTDKASSDSTK